VNFSLLLLLLLLRCHLTADPVSGHVPASAACRGATELAALWPGLLV